MYARGQHMYTRGQHMYARGSICMPEAAHVCQGAAHVCQGEAHVCQGAAHVCQEQYMRISWKHNNFIFELNDCLGTIIFPCILFSFCCAINTFQCLFVNKEFCQQVMSHNFQ